tara:strand:+ start:15562 stop:15903 length:342 start_codon:yes stop_codon:yes gene_type:complete
MITKEFLQSCTDEQISKGVAWLGVRSLLSIRSSRNCEIYKLAAKNILLRSISGSDDYCINPDISWSVILENRIGIKPRGVDSDWYAYQGKIEVISENPLRAAMEVYILMSTQS